ncbi:MAG TPA: hypothetical protein VFK39_04375, partial [Gemmatimonadaceae bacterium]|nr:hypothetical protein [Gemmatimonadaceae bacterium]
VDARRSIARFEQIERQGRIGSVDDEITDGRILDAWLALARSDTATANKLATEVLKENGYFDGKRRKIFHSALILAAESALALGDVRGALQYAQSAGEIATSDSLCATRSAFVGEARLVEGRARLALGDSSAARADFQHALGALRYGAGADHPLTIEAERLFALVESDLKP